MTYKGKDVRNVFHLQTPEDANSVARLANNKNAVIVGTSFVGEKKTHLFKTCADKTTEKRRENTRKWASNVRQWNAHVTVISSSFIERLELIYTNYL